MRTHANYPSEASSTCGHPSKKLLERYAKQWEEMHQREARERAAEDAAVDAYLRTKEWR